MEKEANQARTKRMSFWQLGLGLILFLLGLKNFDLSGPAELKPANAGEAVGYYGITFMILAFGAFFIANGLRMLFRKSKGSDESGR